MLAEKRNKFKDLEVFVGKLFSQPGLKPNHYTFLAVFFALFCLYSLTGLNIRRAFASFLIAAFLDFVDGSVARFQKKATKKGAYLDTVWDRYVEGIVLLGFLFLPLPSFIFPASFWVLLALLGSFMTTYSKAAAKEKELVLKELKKGWIGRGERLILVSFSFLLGFFNISFMLYPLVILAFLSNITALQRIWLALHPGHR